MLKHLDQFGFKADFAMQCLNKNKHNQVTTTYYLMHKKFEKEGKLKSGFKVESTPKKEKGNERISIKESEGPVHADSPTQSPEKRKRRFSIDS